MVEYFAYQHSSQSDSMSIGKIENGIVSYHTYLRLPYYSTRYPLIFGFDITNDGKYILIASEGIEDGLQNGFGVFKMEGTTLTKVSSILRNNDDRKKFRLSKDEKILYWTNIGNSDRIGCFSFDSATEEISYLPYYANLATSDRTSSGEGVVADHENLFSCHGVDNSCYFLKKNTDNSFSIASTYSGRTNAAAFAHKHDYVCIAQIWEPNFRLLNINKTTGAVSLAATFNVNYPSVCNFSKNDDYIILGVGNDYQGFKILDHTTKGSLSLATTYTLYKYDNYVCTVAHYAENEKYIITAGQKYITVLNNNGNSVTLKSTYDGLGNTRYIRDFRKTYSYGSQIKYYNGSGWVEKPVKRYDGSAWVETTIKRYNGSSWVDI